MVIPDGLSDLRIKKYKNKTPLDKAKIPHIDYMLKNGLTGAVKSIPKNKPPGSDVANLSLMGVNTNSVCPGRGALEALAQNIKIKHNETAFRANFVTIEKNIMKDYTGGNIKTHHGRHLINFLNKNFDNAVRFYPGVDYRNIVIIRKSNLKLKTEPPHNILDRNIQPYLPRGKDGAFITNIMKKSNKILSESGYFKKKKLKANYMWLWGEGGQAKDIISFYKKYNLKGAVISAVDIMKSIAGLLKMDIIKVPGITGDFNTNYYNKAKYALTNLKKYDFIFIHIEAPDEAGHKGDFQEKKKTVEKIDKDIIKPLLENNQKFNISFLPDHPTPLKYRTHTNQEVPFILYSKEKSLVPNHKFNHYSEQIIKNPPVFIKNGHQFLDRIMDMIKK